MSLLALVLMAAVAGASGDEGQRQAPRPGVQCQPTPCDGTECWTVRVVYHRDGVQRQAQEVGGYWGTFASVECWADHVAVAGFWLPAGEEYAPTKVPPAVIELL